MSSNFPSRERRLVLAATELASLRPGQDTCIQIPVRETLYGVIDVCDEPSIKAVEIDEKLDVLILPTNYMDDHGRVTFARLDRGINGPERIRSYQESVEIDPEGRVWTLLRRHVSRPKPLEEVFADLTLRALNTANTALADKLWRSESEYEDAYDADVDADDYAKELVRYYNGKLGICGIDYVYEQCRSPVYEIFVLNDEIEALCYDYDELILPRLELIRFFPENWVRNCLVLPIYEFGAIKPLFAEMGEMERARVYDEHDYLTLETCTRIAQNVDDENLFEFLDQAVLGICSGIETLDGFTANPENEEILKGLTSWSGHEATSGRVAMSSLHHLKKLRAIIDGKFKDDFERYCKANGWPLIMSPLQVLEIRFSWLLKLSEAAQNEQVA